MRCLCYENGVQLQQKGRQTKRNAAFAAKQIKTAVLLIATAPTATLHPLPAADPLPEEAFVCNLSFFLS